MASLIISGGEMRSEVFWRRALESNGPLICADQGWHHARKLGIKPQVIIGDFDSADPPPKDIRCIEHPSDKDVSDTQLAIEYALQQGHADIWLLGLLGGRPDHAYANLSLLRLAPGRLVAKDADYEALCIDASRGGEHHYHCQEGENCSLFAMGNSAALVSTSGLKYELEQTPLRSDSHGLSNQSKQENVGIHVHAGTVLLFRTWADK